MKKYGGVKKWTQGRSRIVRAGDQSKLRKGSIESFKMFFDKLNFLSRKKRSWEK